MSTQLLTPEFATPGEVRAGCVFCQNLMVPSARRDVDVLFFDDDEFVAFASLGGFIEGWLLVAPRRHVINLGELTHAEAKRFATFRSDVTAAVERLYGPTVSFEHGPSCHGQDAGCGVDHAHLHIVPWGERIAPRLAVAAPVDTKWQSGLASLEDVAVRRSAYVYLRDVDGTETTGFSDSIPSQLVRRVLRKQAFGDDRYDWRSHPSLSTVSRTIARLR